MVASPLRGNALVVGAGVAGLTAAYWLRRAGYDVVVIDRAKWPRRDGYVIDFYGPGYRVAEEMGMIPELERARPTVSHWTFKDVSGLPLFALPYDTVRQSVFAGRHIHCYVSDIERQLLSLVCDDAEVVFDRSVVRIRNDGPRVTAVLSDGESRTVDLVVGAGGRRSVTRRLWFDAGAETQRYLGFDVAAFSVQSRELRRMVASEARVLSGPSRQVTVYPAPGDNISASFVSTRDVPATPSGPAEIVHELRREFAAFGGVVPAILEAADGAAEIRYESAIQLMVSHWSAGSVVLVGDACHSTSALTGHGVTLAMAGARTLVRELVAAGGHVRRGFASYERRMRPTVHSAQRASQFVARWVAPESKTRMLMRDLALRASVLPIGSTIARRALGIAP